MFCVLLSGFFLAVFSGGLVAQKFNNIYNNSNNSSVFSGLGSGKITSADSANSYLIFEQSDGDEERAGRLLFYV